MAEIKDSCVILDNPPAIQYYQLAALKGAVKLEGLGMKHSSGQSARKHACQLLGLKPSTRAEVVVEKLEVQLANMRSQLTEECVNGNS